MAMQVTVQDVMTRSPVTVRAEATIDQVLNTLVGEGLTSVYITTQDNRLTGIVTDYEVLKHQVLGADRSQSIETLMSRTVPTVRPEESALAVCPQFRDGRLARMAVVDQQGHLIGNLSRRDVMRMIVAQEQIAAESPEAVGNGSGRQSAAGSIPSPRMGTSARRTSPVLCRS